MPFVFVAPSSSVSGARDDVVLWGPGAQHDWEIELAIVIGRHAHRVSREDAMEHVAGYTISNDVSTRDLMFRPNFSMTDFLMSKGRPGFFPTGPYIVPREFVDDYRQLRLTLRVNGEAMQDELVDDIIYGVEDLVAYASTVTELRPGDILLTGSPGGTPATTGNRWLRPGGRAWRRKDHRPSGSCATAASPTPETGPPRRARPTRQPARSLPHERLRSLRTPARSSTTSAASCARPSCWPRSTASTSAATPRCTRRSAPS